MERKVRSFVRAGITALAGILCMGALGTAPAPAKASTLSVDLEQSYTMAYEVLDLVNEQRTANGLSALTMDKDLLETAMQRAAEISIAFSHTRPNGKTCFTVSSKCKGENIAMGQTSASEVMEGWMNSYGHKKNILWSSYTTIGIGVAKINGSYYWVQDFGKGTVNKCSKSADCSKTRTVEYSASTLTAQGATWAVYPVKSDGITVTAASSDLVAGSSQRYALFIMPWSGSNYYKTKVADSEVTWSIDNTAVAGVSNGTVTGNAAGSFTLTASTGGGAICATLSRNVSGVTYKVNFKSNGYTYGSTQTIDAGGTVAKPADPTRSSYTFQGWYSDADCTKLYDFSTPVTTSFTLYAKWQSVTGKVITGNNTTNGTKGSSSSTTTNTTTTTTKTNTTTNAGSGTSSKANVAASPTKFSDVSSGTWYYTWVTQAAQRGLMSGYKDGNGNYTGYFGPDDQVTRAMVAMVLYRMADSPSVSYTGKFPDVAKGAWYTDAVEWCVARGIITGYTAGENAGKFCPDKAVTREELATMVYRFAKWSGATTTNTPAKSFNKCSDTGTVSNWSHDAMVWCAAAGVLTGSIEGGQSYLNPQNSAIRAQGAKVFVQVEKIVDSETSAYSLDDEEAEDVEELDGAETEIATYSLVEGAEEEVTFDTVVGTDATTVAETATTSEQPGTTQATDANAADTFDTVTAEVTEPADTTDPAPAEAVETTPDAEPAEQPADAEPEPAPAESADTYEDAAFDTAEYVEDSFVEELDLAA